MDELIHVFGVPTERLQLLRDGEVVGTVRFDCQQDLTVFVLPQYRRQGIATKLIDEARRVWIINWSHQHFTRAGAAFFEAYFRDAGLPLPAALRATRKSQLQGIRN